MRTEPDYAPLTSGANFEHLFRLTGQDGWELASVQALLHAKYDWSTNLQVRYGLRLSLTAGC